MKSSVFVLWQVAAEVALFSLANIIWWYGNMVYVQRNCENNLTTTAAAVARSLTTVVTKAVWLDGTE